MNFALPPFIVLVPYALFLLFFLFFALVNIYNLAKYGARNMVGFTVSFLFIVGTAGILYLTWQTTVGLDWATPIPILGGIQSPF